ncbi:MAG: ImpA family metalloprotease, partial [Gammaproteobacteria bacterium]
IEFDGILRHPLLSDFSATAIQQYLTELESGVFDWTDVKTPFAEVHSLTRHMLRSFARQDGDESNGYTVADVQEFLSELNTYTIISHLSFAGFVGVGLTPVNTNVLAFCTARNLNCTDPVIHRKPKVQHINADNRALCGFACAGNPFDKGGAIAPLSGKENHEMGHNLQRNRLKIYGPRSTEVSTIIFPVHVGEQWGRDQGLVAGPNGERAGHQTAFLLLQQAVLDGAVPGDQHPVWGAQGVEAAQRAFYIQLTYIHGSWDIYTKMYLVERIYTDAIGSDAKWAAAAADLGFSIYTRAEAMGLGNGNDFMYITASLIDGRDFADHFEIWGIEISDKAKAQVQANGVTGSVPTLIYFVENDQAFTTFPNIPGNERPLDGVTAWQPAAPAMASSLQQKVDDGAWSEAASKDEQGLAGAASAAVSTGNGPLGFRCAQHQPTKSFYDTADITGNNTHSPGAADGFRLAARRYLFAIGRGDVDVHGPRRQLPVHLLYTG